MAHFRPINRDTGFLMPPSVDEWLPEKHLARFVVEVIAGLDLRAMIGSYRGCGEAQSAAQMAAFRDGGADARTLLKSFGALVLMAHPGDEGTKEWLIDTIKLLFGEGAHWSADEIQQQAYRSCLRITRERAKSHGDPDLSGPLLMPTPEPFSQELPTPPPPSAPPSQPSQPNPTKNAAPDSRELNNTLERLRAMQRQTQAPTARANPAPGSSSGGPSGTLSANQRGAIVDKVRECWPKDSDALDLEKMQGMLVVTVDGEGVARQAVIAPEESGRMGDPRFRAFAERAIRAVLNPRCASLPLPHTLISGARTTFKFRFSPP